MSGRTTRGCPFISTVLASRSNCPTPPPLESSLCPLRHPGVRLFAVSRHDVLTPCRVCRVLHGKKRWLLFPAGQEPAFDSSLTSLQWLASVYPTLLGTAKAPLECVIEPGEALYFPGLWYHLTLNIAPETPVPQPFLGDGGAEEGQGTRGQRSGVVFLSSFTDESEYGRKQGPEPVF